MSLSLNLLCLRIRTLVIVVAAAALAVSGCSGGDGDGGDDPDASQPTVTAAPSVVSPDDPEETATATTEPATTTAAPTTTAPTTTATEQPTITAPLPLSPPYRAELPSGPFLLADRIAHKLTLDQTLRFGLSIGTPADLGSGPAMDVGFVAGAAESSERHGASVEARLFADFGTAGQAQRINDLVVQGELDCIVVEVAEPGAPASAALATAIDRAVNSGVPVFTVNGDSADSRRFAFYGLDPLSAGMRTGEAVGRWAVDGRILLRKAGVLAGDAQSERSQLLMEGFMAGIISELPEIEFVNGPDTVESFGFDPNEVYDEAGDWILDRLDVDIVFYPDRGMEYAATVIADWALYGDVSLAGFHMSEAIANYIREGVVVAAMLPGLADQAAAGAEACGDFLLAGVYDTGHVAIDPVAVTEENIDDRDWTLPENR